MTKRERSNLGRALQALRKVKTGGSNGGRPRSDAPRCACGAMTLKLAEIRRHRCDECVHRVPLSEFCSACELAK